MSRLPHENDLLNDAYDALDPKNLVVDLSTVEQQLCELTTMFLRGRIDVQTYFSRVAPLFEESQSPRAERIVQAVGMYSVGDLTLGQLKRELERLNELLQA